MATQVLYVLEYSGNIGTILGTFPACLISANHVLNQFIDTAYFSFNLLIYIGIKFGYPECSVESVRSLNGS